jgi:hypothetical protein
MSAKEQKIALIVKRYNLPSLKLWHGREKRLEHASNRMAQTGDKIIQNEFRIMGCSTSVALR